MVRRGVKPPAPAQRLWRLRKLHQQVDAELRDGVEMDVELRFLYNGGLVYTRRWDSRGAAVAEAAEKHAELERGGWTAHW